MDKGDAARPGAVFKGRNANGGKTWTTKCTVTAAEPGRVFAFDVKHTLVPVAHWRYDIAPVDGGCRVTEQTWDRRPGWFRKPAGIATGVTDRTGANARHIELTLQRLKARAEARSPGYGRPVMRSARPAMGDVVARPRDSWRSASA